MELLHQLLQEQHFSDSTDLWHYIWGSPLFSSKKAYLHLTGHAQEHAVFSWLWKSSCQKNIRFSFGFFLRIDSVPGISSVRPGTVGLPTGTEHFRVGSGTWIRPTSFVSTRIGVELVDLLGN